MASSEYVILGDSVHSDHLIVLRHIHVQPEEKKSTYGMSVQFLEDKTNN